MKCKKLLIATVAIVDPGGHHYELNARVYYHEAGMCRAKYNHIDVFVPKSHKHIDLLQKGFYNALITKSKLILDLSVNVKGYKLVVELNDGVFTNNNNILYLARVRRYSVGDYIKLTIRLPSNVKIS